MASGYFGIGIYHPLKINNVGTLFRSALYFGAQYIFVIGPKYHRQSSDTFNAPAHIPLYEYTTFDNFYENMPKDCVLVGIETSTSETIETYSHPFRATYLLGPEDNGLPRSILERCHHTIYIPSPRGLACLNVSVAGSIVLYDRMFSQQPRYDLLQKKNKILMTRLFEGTNT